MTTMTLRPYQKKGIQFLKNRKAALLADQPGLGKTIQAICAVKESRDFRILVLCPKIMLDTWGQEIQKWHSGSVVVYVLGSPQQKAEIIKREFLSEIATTKYFITNWESIIQQKTNIDRVHWDVIIADEAHRIKNRKTKTAKCLKKIKTRKKYALSGTPFTNKPEELWSLLNWLAPKNWSSYWKFFETYLEYQNTPWGKQITGLKSGGTTLKKDIQPLVLRRLKSHVLKELPPKSYQHMWSMISPLQHKLYMQLRKEFLAEYHDTTVQAPGVLAQLIRFRQLVISPRLLGEEFPDDSPRLDDIAEYISDLDCPVIVFSNFVGTLHLLATRLQKRGLSELFFIHGQQSQKQNQAAMQQFQTSTGSPVMLATIDAAGVGITLTNANVIVFCDRSWSPAKNEQAEDRAHRIGQDNPVNIISFGIPGTIDERVEKLLYQKKEDFSKVLASDVIGLPDKPGKAVIARG